MKIIKDNIYGFLEIKKSALKIIDTIEFQRLRFIKQLAFTHYVFPSAQHTRFEHCIGVYHLISIFLDYLSRNYKIDNRLKEIICISGLIHDLGHVAFSHMFDHYIIPKIKNGVHHEYRSIQIFKKMNKKYNLGYTDEEITLIHHIIIGIPIKKYPKYIFQIVANKKNELDLDKIDYLMRDGYYLGKQVTFDYKYLFANTKIINQEICYDVKTSFTILSLFNMRYELHKHFYNHKTVILYEQMAIDAIMKSFKYINYQKLFDSDEWLFELTDNILFKLREYPECKKIIDRILSRNLYKLVKEPNNKTITINKHIGLTGQKKNPMIDINFYNKKEEMITLDMKEISIFELICSYEIRSFHILRN